MNGLQNSLALAVEHNPDRGTESGEQSEMRNPVKARKREEAQTAQRASADEQRERKRQQLQRETKPGAGDLNPFVGRVFQTRRRAERHTQG